MMLCFFERGDVVVVEPVLPSGWMMLTSQLQAESSRSDLSETSRSWCLITSLLLKASLMMYFD
jgi:hypothetical protein